MKALNIRTPYVLYTKMTLSMSWFQKNYFWKIDYFFHFFKICFLYTPHKGFKMTIISGDEFLLKISQVKLKYFKNYLHYFNCPHMWTVCTSMTNSQFLILLFITLVDYSIVLKVESKLSNISTLTTYAHQILAKCGYRNL